MTSHYLYFLRHNLSARLLGRKRPLLCGFKITHRCNLKCRICPFWQLDTGDISFARSLEVMDELYRRGLRLMILEGGEPFLWRDEEKGLEDLVRESKRRFFCTGITTNGMQPLETEADTVWVSIDGMRATHDAGRGESFERIVENIRASSHPRIFANVCFSSLNDGEAAELVDYLGGLVRGITVQFYYPFPGSEDLELARERRERVLEKLIALKKRGLPLLDSRSVLESLKRNRWRCHSWLIASVEPDGKISQGCYLENRAGVACEKCGFAAHAEISKAYDWHLPAIRAGARIFGFRWL